MLQFNINVPSSVYAKYYFDLRLLAEANELTFPSEPLSKERALKLEAMAQNYEDKLTQDIVQTGMKRWSSLDKLLVNRRSVAILSWNVHFYLKSWSKMCPKISLSLSLNST